MSKKNKKTLLEHISVKLKMNCGKQEGKVGSNCIIWDSKDQFVLFAQS